MITVIKYYTYCDKNFHTKCIKLDKVVLNKAYLRSSRCAVVIASRIWGIKLGLPIALCVRHKKNTTTLLLHVGVKGRRMYLLRQKLVF